MITKICIKCNVEKELNETNFPFRKDYKVWRNECRECLAIYAHKYRIENREKYLEAEKKARKKNIEKKKAYQRDYYHNIRKNNPIYKIRVHCSRTIHRILIEQKSNRNSSSILKYLPYTIKQLKDHIESLWEPWMNWDNYGLYITGGPRKWHIDHIIPQVDLPYNSMKHPNFKKCWALENLRPLEAIENILRRYKK